MPTLIRRVLHLSLFICCSNWRLPSIGVLVLGGLLVSTITSGQNGPDADPDVAPGYVNSTFHHGQVDSINLYNGQLTVPIAVGPSYPIGPSLKFQLVLSYNSKVTEFGHPAAQDPSWSYQPLAGDPALGVGWNFSLGAIKFSRVGQESGYCYFAPDGSVHIFSGDKTLDGTQFRLQGTGPFDMWDGDGNHYVFGNHVSGYDDSLVSAPGYVRDFGNGRDGWYLTSVTDPFGNSYSASYSSGANPCWSYTSIVCSGTYATQMHCSGSGTWVPSSINLPGGSTISIGRDPVTASVSSFTFPVFAGGSSSTAVWSLQYTTANQALPCYLGSSNTITLREISAIQMPSAVGSYQFTYGSGFLTRVQLPTGATIDYCFGSYTFHHGRIGALEPGCGGEEPGGPGNLHLDVTITPPACAVGSGGNAPSYPGGGSAPFVVNIPGGCSTNNESRWTDHSLGVTQRTETANGQAATTKYTQ